MESTQQPIPETSAPPAAADPTNPAARTAPPTKEERIALVHSLQSQALHREDPLLANLDFLNGDMFMVAQAIFEDMQETLSKPASKQRAEQLLRDRDLHLRYARLIDRYSQITRQPAPKPKGPSS